MYKFFRVCMYRIIYINTTKLRKKLRIIPIQINFCEIVTSFSIQIKNNAISATGDFFPKNWPVYSSVPNNRVVTPTIHF